MRGMDMPRKGAPNTRCCVIWQELSTERAQGRQGPAGKGKNTDRPEAAAVCPAHQNWAISVLCNSVEPVPSQHTLWTLHPSQHCGPKVHASTMASTRVDGYRVSTMVSTRLSSAQGRTIAGILLV